MREIAQRADSAINGSGDLDKPRNNSETRRWAALSLRMREFPSATQALRTSPRHFVRLIGLPRNTRRKSSSVKDASHSSVGIYSDSFISFDSAYGLRGPSVSAGTLRG